MLSSKLNPEAPEFHPLPDAEMITTTEEGYKLMTNATRISNTFPIGSSYAIFKTFTDFNIVICKLRSNVITQSSQIMVTELPSVNLKGDDNDGNTEKILDATDNMLDRINVHVDTSTGENKRAAAIECGAQPASAARGPRLAKLKLGDMSAMLGSSEIPRPQLSFSDPVDNSDSLHVPRIRNKPNGKKPLALTILYDEDDYPVGYENPYLTELQSYEPPGWAMRDDGPPAPPAPLEATPLTRVDSPPQLAALVRHLATVREIAVDLEHHSYRSYLGFTCLMQISTDSGGDFLVDALALRDELHVLNQAFTDPKIVKVFHGAAHDVLWLQRDFGLYVVGMFDTYQAARALPLAGRGLKHLLLRYCALRLDKSHQVADWRIRPLPDELVQYARCDTHYLLYVYRRMRRELLARGPDLLRSVFFESGQRAKEAYAKPVLTADSHLLLPWRAGKVLTGLQLETLMTVHAWRDEHARALDESTGYLLPNYMLMALAETLPRDLRGIHAVTQPTPPFLNRHVDELLRIMLECRSRFAAGQAGRAGWGAGCRPPAPDAAAQAAHDFVGVLNPRRWETIPPAGAQSKPAERRSDATPSALPDGEKSGLNAGKRVYVPPFYRFEGYRGACRRDAGKVLGDANARADEDGIVTLHARAPPRRRKLYAAPPLVLSSAWREEPKDPAEQNASRRRRNRHAKNNNKKATETRQNDKPANQPKEKVYKPFNYKYAHLYY